MTGQSLGQGGKNQSGEIAFWPQGGHMLYDLNGI